MYWLPKSPEHRDTDINCTNQYRLRSIIGKLIEIFRTPEPIKHGLVFDQK